MALFHSRLFWTQAALRAVSVALLLACLGFLIHSTIVFTSYVYNRSIAGYVAVRSSSPPCLIQAHRLTRRCRMKDVVLIVFHMAVLKRVCARILGKVTVPGRAEAGWMFALDMAAIAAAILAGVFLMFASEKDLGCRRWDCDVVYIYLNDPSWASVVYLLYAVGYVAAVFLFFVCIFPSKSLIPSQGYSLTIDRRGLLAIPLHTTSNTLHDKSCRWPAHYS
jgi:hypothetical protein